MSCPLPFSSAHSFRRLSDVHNCRRIGSPRVAGSSSALRSESSWVLGYPRFTPATLPAYPVILNRGTVLEIFKPSIYCPSRQPRRLSHGAHTTVSNHTRFRRRPASPAPLIQQRSHRLPTFPKSSDVRTVYHATILSRPILFRESPSYNSCRE